MFDNTRICLLKSLETIINQKKAVGSLFHCFFFFKCTNEYTYLLLFF